MQRNSKPIPWRPRGLSDTLDASDTFNGAMSFLQNLIPDPTTKNLWQCRPASSRLTNFAGFTTPGFISVYIVVGSLAIGMVASGRNAGKDEPFVYNLATSAFVTVTGITNANSPTSPATSGAWTPPTMDIIGAKVIVTHPGFNAAGGFFFGVFDISNPAAPTWTAQNLTGAVTFSVLPSAVANFNGRAYFIQNVIAQPGVVYTDVLVPTNVTSGNQVITFDDNTALTAFGKLQLNNQLGGIVQSLMVFKGVSNIYQIVGDAATSSLSKNSLSVATGTLAPLSIAETPKGLAFMSPDGLRLIDFSANVSDPIGMDGQGVAVPFINAVQPSRIAAACGGSVLRISVQNGAAAGSPFQEYWYDFARSIWHGPHTFPASSIQPYQKTFIVAPQGVVASLWQSDPVQSSTSSFVENGTQLTFTWQTPFLPDTDQMTNNAMTETTLDFAFGVGTSTLTIAFFNQKSSVLNQVSLTQQTSVTTWGSFVWGQATWGGTVNPLSTYQIPWTQPIVFTRGALQVSGVSAQGVKIGTAHLRYQVLRYTSQIGAQAA